jgi:hypothetical protein
MVDRDSRPQSATDSPLNWYLISRIGAVFIGFSLLGIGVESVNFDSQKPGSMPASWTPTATRPARTPDWEIRPDKSAPSRPNVLQQLSTAPEDSEFPLAIFDKVQCRDGDLSVKFKIAAEPRRIKATGIVWRYQDQRNYYLLRFSVDEHNIEMFRVQDGQMRAISSAVPHELKTGEWYVAKVMYRGNRFRVLFGNRQLFEATDDSLATPGKTGLWTRAGTVASFDDFRLDKKG